MYFKIGQHVRIAKKVREQKENNGSDYRYFEKVIFEVLREPYGDFGDVRVRVVSNEKITKSLRGGCGADSFVICGSIPIPKNSLVGAEYNFIESALEPWIYVAPAEGEPKTVKLKQTRFAENMFLLMRLKNICCLPVIGKRANLHGHDVIIHKSVHINEETQEPDLDGEGYTITHYGTGVLLGHAGTAQKAINLVAHNMETSGPERVRQLIAQYPTINPAPRADPLTPDEPQQTNILR